MSDPAAGPILPLLRRWAIDWICGHHAATCEEILGPDYTLCIGTAEIRGRDTYVKATSQQFAYYPGMMLTVHEVLANQTQAAVRFTEHGASVRHNGSAAAWAGVALMESDGRRIVRGWANEDYQARRRQLASGKPDRIPGSAAAPWDTPLEAANAETEGAVRSWIMRGLPAVDGVVWDDTATVPCEPLMIADRGEAVILISAGSLAAFHGRIIGVATDGSRKEISMSVSGMVSVADGRVCGGSVVSDRLGALSALRGGGN